jgi:hypothetical protein
MRKHTEAALWMVVFGLPLLVTQISATKLKMMVGALWLASIVLVVPLHFCKAWQRFGSVPNKREYALWVGLETIFAAGLLGSFGYAVLAR